MFSAAVTQKNIYILQMQMIWRLDVNISTAGGIFSGEIKNV